MRTFFVALCLVALVFGGCARFPDGGGEGLTTRLIFTMEVDGVLRTGSEPGSGGAPYVYIIALRLSKEINPTDEGPIPVVVPSGNGFVAGNATHFIIWNPLASPSYQIWRFLDEELNDYVQIGVPINFVPVQTAGNRLEFEVDLSQLVPVSEVPEYRSVQVNFLTMNNTNTSGGGRLWDALGDSADPSQINSFFTVPLTFSQLYDNARAGGIEPQGDVIDPDLDIIDWSIEVRLP